MHTVYDFAAEEPDVVVSAARFVLERVREGRPSR